MGTPPPMAIGHDSSDAAVAVHVDVHVPSVTPQRSTLAPMISRQPTVGQGGVLHLQPSAAVRLSSPCEPVSWALNGSSPIRKSGTQEAAPGTLSHMRLEAAALAAQLEFLRAAAVSEAAALASLHAERARAQAAHEPLVQQLPMQGAMETRAPGGGTMGLAPGEDALALVVAHSNAGVAGRVRRRVKRQAIRRSLSCGHLQAALAGGLAAQAGSTPPSQSPTPTPMPVAEKPMAQQLDMADPRQGSKSVNNGHEVGEAAAAQPSTTLPLAAGANVAAVCLQHEQVGGDPALVRSLQQALLKLQSDLLKVRAVPLVASCLARPSGQLSADSGQSNPACCCRASVSMPVRLRCRPWRSARLPPVQPLRLWRMLLQPGSKCGPC
jgi:hypothetical protein